MQSHQVVPDVQRELRWIADSYEQAQRVRIQTGERIRALLQGRDSAVDGERERNRWSQVLQWPRQTNPSAVATDSLH
jgi:hypothetical protein